MPGDAQVRGLPPACVSVPPPHSLYPFSLFFLWRTQWVTQTLSWILLPVHRDDPGVCNSGRQKGGKPPGATGGQHGEARPGTPGHATCAGDRLLGRR